MGPLLGLTRLVSLKLAELRITDGDCAGIAALARLTLLDLRDSMVSDAGVQELSRLTSLQCLDLTWTKVTAPPALSSLTRLHMDNCQVILPLPTCSAMPSMPWVVHQAEVSSD